MKKLLIFSVLCLILASCASSGGASGLTQLQPPMPTTVPTQSGSVSNQVATSTSSTQVATPTSSTQVATPATSTGVSGTKSASLLPGAGLPNFDHIILIMLENRSYSSVINGNQMPLLTALAAQNVLLTNYFAVAHPSLPNYISLMSGSSQGITSDCTNCFVSQPNLADEIEASGRTWKSYLEGMPSPCFVGNSGNYAQKHDPLLYFDSVRLNAARCDRSIVPLTSLDSDLASNQLPNFSFIMPDLCNSGHNCSAGTADKWVSGMVARLQASTALGKNSLIMIVFDEASDTDTSGCCGLAAPAGGQVAAVLISPSATPGFNDQTPYSHFGLLKTILTAWNLPALGHTADASTQPILAPWTGLPSQSAPSNPITPTATQPPAATQPTTIQAATCASSSPASGTYTIRVCFTDPASGTALSGDVNVSAAIQVTGVHVGVQRLVFYLDGAYLLTSFSRPYGFTLPTTNWIDGNHTLSVEADMNDSFVSRQGIFPVVFANGITSIPSNTNQFHPTSGNPAVSGAPFVVAAGGDGASGEPNAANVSDLITSLHPNLFLYLGDVYQNGSTAEFYNWFGTSSKYFGRLKSITDPTIGNHEYLTQGASGYFNYWDNIPNYYSFNADGWHFISLNSNAPRIGVDPGSEQYKWLQQDLAANSQACTIVYYHHPLFNIGKEPAATYMSDIWSLLAQSGVSIVLNGHDHDYQRWVPLDGNGQPSPNGVTEFVVGSAGHGIQKFSMTDNRVAFASDTPPAAFGVLLLQLSPTGATFTYQSTNGSTLDSGSIPCGHAAPATQAP